jgi:hypothetical protein
MRGLVIAVALALAALVDRGDALAFDLPHGERKVRARVTVAVVGRRRARRDKHAPAAVSPAVVCRARVQCFGNNIAHNAPATASFEVLNSQAGTPSGISMVVRQR